MIINVKKMCDSAQMPYRGSTAAAGYDLKAAYEATISPGETRPIHTGLSMEIPEGYFGGIFARSGLAIKQGMRPANCVGVIDADYRGEIIVALHNDSNETRFVAAGERVAQLVILPFLPVGFQEVEELDTTERGAGGFGSTGTN